MTRIFPRCIGEKRYVNVYKNVNCMYLFMYEKKSDDFYGFSDLKNESSILDDSMRNEYRYRSSLPECYFEGVKGP